MSRILIPLLALAAAIAPAPARGEDTSGLFGQINEIVAELSRITGLKPLKKVDFASITKPEVSKFLRERLKEEMAPEEIRAEELVLKKFGFVPAEYNLANNTIDLYTEQAAAFYDFRKKKLFVLDSAPGELQRLALVHELAHALADQHFQLEKFIRHGGASDDSSLARMSVMEGQAAWLMSEYMARRMGQSLKGSGGVAEMVRRTAELSAGQFPVFDASPLYIRETMLFPYTHGMLFQHVVLEKLGQEGFREVFKRPPTTAQQVLHPAKYFARVESTAPLAPKPARMKEYKLLTEGTLGEFDHQILLRQFGMEKDGPELAERWRGGAYALYERKDRTRAVLSYASDWDGAETAARFLAAYRRILKSKWKAMEVISETPGRLVGRGDDGFFVLRLSDCRVTSVEGFGSSDEAEAVR
jgi:hypothetical protein